ncbi:DUF1178 family protein [Falsiroseomonas sp. HW251]|uniref:DUF1178 family protein n=1 Tax=Falsiroseomonas sp. HW251 TaxID=3390998 RepID=UPI003D318737
MIRYKLRCGAGHEFESWFQDGAGFEKLAKAGLVECAVCGSAAVEKALMAPAVVSSRKKARPPAPPQAEAPPPAPPSQPPQGPQMAAGPMPAQVMAMLQRLRAEVEKNCDYVGKDFAEEARKIHTGEAEARGIYGEASDAEAEALADEGIDIARLPWVPRADG